MVNEVCKVYEVVKLVKLKVFKLFLGAQAVRICQALTAFLP